MGEKEKKINLDNANDCGNIIFSLVGATGEKK